LGEVVGSVLRSVNPVVYLKLIKALFNF